MTFKNLGLSAELLRAIEAQGYTTPTEVQQQAIPVILEGRDILAGAQTGTGKTAGFALPTLHLLNKQIYHGQQRKIRALVLTPTRELAMQVQDCFTNYGEFLPLKSMTVFGGVNIRPQISRLKRGVDILVATPGRLLDHLNQNTVDLSHVEYLILDEADRMLDMGFIADIKKVLAHIPKQRQTILFSATYSDQIRKLANSLQTDPILIEVARENTTAERVDQLVHPVEQSQKRALLSLLIKEQNWDRVLVFTRTKHGAERLSKQLCAAEISAVAIHGDKSQSQRTRALKNFKNNQVQVLVATDIAARGLDIDQLPHVVNFDLPNVAEDYVHRIGRTGRAGHAGHAVSLVCPDETQHLRSIERLIGEKIKRENVPGFETDLNQAPSKSVGKTKKKPNNRSTRRSTPRHTAKPSQGRPQSKRRPGSKSSFSPTKKSG